MGVLDTREMLIQTALRFHFTPIKIGDTKKKKKVLEDVSKSKSLNTVVEDAAWGCYWGQANENENQYRSYLKQVSE